MIVEDDADQRNNYKDAIKKKGYEVVAYGNRADALANFEKVAPDLAILDIILGEEVDGGFELCRELLAKSPTLPIIFLTERIDEIDKISGLRLGAWDYLSKPISLNYLTVRIYSLLSLNQSNVQEQGTSLSIQAGEDVAAVGDLLLKHDTLSALWKNQLINLSGTEFRMLATLTKTPGRRISYQALTQAAMQSLVTHNTINTHMHNIRKKIRRLDRSFSCIKNEYGYGYRWSTQ